MPRVSTQPSSDAGFHTIYLHPTFDSRIGNVDFSYESPYGEIKSAWAMKGSATTWTVTVPPNTTASLPLSASRVDAFTLGGKKLAASQGVTLDHEDGGMKYYKLAAGTYAFKVANP